MFVKDWKKDLFTIPNMLSLFRLVLIPVYIVIYLNAQSHTDYFVAGAILAVSCLTDLIDGKIARHFNMMSRTGQALDPLADKATQFSLIICLTARHPHIIGLLILFVVKEIFQLLAAIFALRKGEMLKGALLSGKICTTVLFISLILMVLLPDMQPLYSQILIGVDCVFMLISFIAYIRAYWTHSFMIEGEDKSIN